MPAARPSTFATRRAAASGRPRLCRPRGESPYTSRHGFGYSVFEHTEDGITSELWVYVDSTEPVKWSVLKIRNTSGRSRRLSVTGYVEWVLGDHRAKAAPHVVTAIDPRHGRPPRRERVQRGVRRVHGLLPRGRRESQRVLATARSSSVATARSGSRPPCGGRDSRVASGAALDPCAAIQVAFELDEGQEREIVFRLGADATAKARQACARPRGTAAARRSLEAVWQYWNRTLGAVNVETPDAALNIAGERLAALPDAGVPDLGAQRLLSVGRRVRLPRPVAGRDGPGPCAKRLTRATAPAAVGGAAVPRRGRAALVASAGGPRSAHAIARTTTCGSRMAVCRYVTATGDTGVLDEARSVL